MHGNGPEYLLLVNAEVDSMGGVIDGGVGIDSKISPRRAAIEKAQAELRHEYDVREERRRELEFLEKGGNPLDFKLGPATSISVQSTSLADQFVNSEAKDSFALTASPRGDSIESSGRPEGTSARETNTADNLLLFDGDNDVAQGGRNSAHRSRNNVPSFDQLSQLDGCHNIKESEESGVLQFVVKSQSYARRNRSKSSRDSARLCSTDLASVVDRNGSSLPRSRNGARDSKGIPCEQTTEKGRTVKSTCHPKSTKQNGNVVGKTDASDNQLGGESDARPAHATASGSNRVGEAEPEVRASKKLRGLEHNQFSQVDAEKVHMASTSMQRANGVDKEGFSSALNCIPLAASPKVENASSTSQTNRVSTSNVDGIDIPKEGTNSIAAFNRKDRVDPDPSCIQIGLSLDGNTRNDHNPSSRLINYPGNSNSATTLGERSTDLEAVNIVKEKRDTIAIDIPADSNDHHTAVCSKNSGSCIKVEVKTDDSRSGMKMEVKSFTNHDKMEVNDYGVSNIDPNSCDQMIDDSNVKKTGLCFQGRASNTTGSITSDPQEVSLTGRGLIDTSELQTSEEIKLKLARKVHEDSVLEEARSIEAKRKRIAELSMRNYPSEYRRKSQWDFVLEEMAWLANDFAQERLWMRTAAAQISHKAASSGRLRLNKQILLCKQKEIAHTMTKGIMKFWRSAEELLKTDSSDGIEDRKLELVGSQNIGESEVIEDKISDTDMEMSGHLKEQSTLKSRRLAIQDYAVRFLKHSLSLNCPIHAEAPKTPERISDSGIVEMLSEDHFSEETLFYKVPLGAMEEYRKSLENHWSQYEKIGGSLQLEEAETSIHGTVEEFGARENTYEEDGVGAYCMPRDFDGIKSSKSAQKNKKNTQKAYARSYDVGTDMPYGQFTENKLGSGNSLFVGKRPSNSSHAGAIPIKRVRTASRRVVCAGAAGGLQMSIKADASSGDTSSYQDDQSTVHGGSNIRKASEVESTGEFGKQLAFDCTEVSMKPKKKKKAKHLVYKNSLSSTDNGVFVSRKGPAYDPRWQPDSMVQNKQRDYSKKRQDSHAFESNGNSGVFGQHATKRLKIAKQLQDTSESNTPQNGLVPSPMASQMSNMSNPNKFMKMIAGRDRGRKTKALKMPTGQSGVGSPWSIFEDQALVVLVHDMGPNWELVSDAISSTLQFKCIFRNPKECKERHRILMDRNAGDGADSAEDSGSSQPYPSTLPGIPKGSARQLFQRLQGPMEEDTLKSHFEKIILIGQKQHSRRIQSDDQALKQIPPVHSSHIVALSQVSPNNLSGIILTPLDLCDTTSSSSEAVSLGYQGPHTSGLAISTQSPTPLVHPTATSGANPMLQGSTAVIHDNSLPSPSAALSTSSRDSQRYGVPRPSLPNNESQKMQQYNQMLPGKNSQHSSVSVPGSLPTDRGVRILAGGNGMGMMSGIGRGMPMPRPAYQGTGSPAMLNMVSSESMLSSSGTGMSTPVNIHNGAISGQGNSMMRTHEALHTVRAPEEQRQMTMQELQMQASQGNNQVITPFNAVSAGYPNQSVSPSVQTFPVQHQQHQRSQQQSHVISSPHHQHLQGNNHATTPQQQAYMLRMAKDRQLHQRLLHQHNQQQQHQFAPANANGPHVQPLSQHPISPLVHSSSQNQQQASSQPVASQQVSLPSTNAQHLLTSSLPMNPVSSQSQQKHHLPPHGLGRNPQPGGVNLSNQVQKQRQRQQQPHQQPGRHHMQQRQQSQSHQQAKHLKGVGRGNTMMHQSITDTSQVNGVSIAPGNQVAEQGEQALHLMHGQGLFSGSITNPVQSGKSLIPPQTTNQGSVQQKFSRSPPPSSKQHMQMSSHVDKSNQGQVPPVSSGHTLLASQLPGHPLVMPSSPQQQQHQLPQPRQTGQSQQSIHRMLPQNRQVSCDSSLQPSTDHMQGNQRSPNSTFHMVTSTTPPQCCTDSTSIVPVSSGTAPSQWNSQEPLYELSTLNSNSHLAGNLSMPSSSGSEPLALPSHGISQRQSSSSMATHTHSVQTQWQPHLQQQKQQLLPPAQHSTQLTQQPPPSQEPPHQPQQS